MASYPTSVYAPATKNVGDSITPALFNNPEAEIIALEGALINGPINLAASTVVTLSVTGGSTFVGPVTLPRWPVCKVTNSANQQMPSGAFLGLNWDTESYDSTGMHSTASNSSRVLLNSSGVWAITGQITWVGNATPIRQAQIFLNDVTALAGNLKAAVNIDPYPQQVSARYLATSTTDYVTLRGLCNGSTGSVYGADATYGGCWLAVERVSQ